MNYDESTVERLCSANNFCGMPMWLKYQNYLFSTVEEKLDLSNAGPWGLFLKDARQILPQLVERPRGFE
jgi:hypothetical protein